VVSPNYVVELDATTWGWIHLIVGIVVALAGFFVLTGKTWARVIAILVVSLSAIANFAFIPQLPDLVAPDYRHRCGRALGPGGTRPRDVD
jgi:hypothetical protein